MEKFLLEMGVTSSDFSNYCSQIVASELATSKFWLLTSITVLVVAFVYGGYFFSKKNKWSDFLECSGFVISVGLLIVGLLGTIFNFIWFVDSYKETPLNKQYSIASEYESKKTDLRIYKEKLIREIADTNKTKEE